MTVFSGHYILLVLDGVGGLAYIQVHGVRLLGAGLAEIQHWWRVDAPTDKVQRPCARQFESVSHRFARIV